MESDVCRGGMAGSDKEIMSGLSERRRATRFMVELPVELKQGRGITRDFSTEGICFETDQSLSVGEHIELVVALEHSYYGQSMRLRCCGEVVRVASIPGKIGVAVAFTTHSFEAGQGSVKA